jgi:hypothetical protein
MNERRTIAQELSALEQALRDLEIRYDQYFNGVEKREPMAARDAVAKRIRTFSTRKIVQTDLRFKYQTLAGRFQTYSQYWDRIARMIDEGRFHRQIPSAAEGAAKPESPPLNKERVEQIYQELLQAHGKSNSTQLAPTRQQLAEFLDQQLSRIREKFGNREVEFRVASEDGKPRIKVRAKK